MLLPIKKRVLIPLVIVFFFSIKGALAQQFNLTPTDSQLTVLGTSNLHDWHITADNYEGQIFFNDIATCDIEKCAISIVSESLKSGKKSMDKNTYKALKTADYKTITFQITKINQVVNNTNGLFSVKAEANLSIIGVTKQISINLDINTSSDKIILTGEKTIKMTDFGVIPPKALFGTITTGDEITIKFKSTFK